MEFITIEIHEVELSSLPENLHEIFPNLIILRWMYGGLTTITSNDLKPFPNLITLVISYNRIVSLDGNLFQHTRQLRDIWITNNQIQHVGHGLLTGMESSYIWLYDNPCISASASTPEEIFKLNLQLPISCPPKAPGECQLRCSLEDETDELQRVANDQGKQISELKKVVSSHEERIEALERIVSELLIQRK